MKKIIIYICLLVVLIPVTASAQQQDQVRGLEIAPFLLDLEVEKGKEITSQIDVVNRSTAPLIVTVTPRDFLPGYEGQPEFVPDIEINDPTFSLAAWVALGIDSQFTLQPGELASVPFTLRPPQNAEDGTHYGALLFSYVASSATGSASEIQQSVGSILLVRYGVGRELGNTVLTANKHVVWSEDKINLYNTFTNTGNVHVQPKGEVYIRNIFGQVVSTPFVNRDAVNVLPKTEREFLSTWIPSSFAFGRYTAESVLVYGRGRLEAKDIQVIWVLPIYMLVLFSLIIATILWFIFHDRHWHKRRIITKHYQKQEKQG